jgi:hypothetical protein
VISAFGVEHGEFSKSLKPAHVKSMARTMTSGAPIDERAAAFSRARLAGNKKGAQAAVAKPSGNTSGFKGANAQRFSRMGQINRAVRESRGYPS